MDVRIYVQISQNQRLILEALNDLCVSSNRADAGEMLEISSRLRTLAAALGSADQMQYSQLLSVISQAPSETDRRMPINATAQILLLVLMWLIVMTVPVAIQESKLPAETQQTLDDYYGLLAGLAVSITFLIAPS